MARILSVLSLLLVLTIALVGVVFVLRNDQLVTVDFLFTEFVSLSLGVWVLASLSVGLVLGLVCSLPAQILLSGSNKMKDKKLHSTQSKLNRLKRSSVKG